MKSKTLYIQWPLPARAPTFEDIEKMFPEGTISIDDSTIKEETTGVYSVQVSFKARTRA